MIMSENFKGREFSQRVKLLAKFVYIFTTELVVQLQRNYLKRSSQKDLKTTIDSCLVIVANILAFNGEDGEQVREYLKVFRSAFSLETFGMLQHGQAVMAAAYAVASVCGAVMFLIVGYTVARIGA